MALLGLLTNATGCKVDHRKSLQPGSFLQQLIRDHQVFGKGIQLRVIHDACAGNLFPNGAGMSNSLDHISRSKGERFNGCCMKVPLLCLPSFAFGTDHGSAFRDATESLAQITATTHKWCLEGSFVDV